jgi:uncharacterized membrane protein YesL
LNRLIIIFNFFKKYVDYKMGIYGAIVMGGIIFGINYHGTDNYCGALTAALKQAVYTFLFGGIIMRMCELLATNIKQKSLALFAASFIPSVISLSLTFAMHSLKGTPKPLASTIPTVFFVIPATIAWGIMKRKKHQAVN